MERHFVTFFSPGVFLAEQSVKPIDSWDVAVATAEVSRFGRDWLARVVLDGRELAEPCSCPTRELALATCEALLASVRGRAVARRCYAPGGAL